MKSKLPKMLQWKKEILINPHRLIKLAIQPSNPTCSALEPGWKPWHRKAIQLLMPLATRKTWRRNWRIQQRNTVGRRKLNNAKGEISATINKTEPYQINQQNREAASFRENEIFWANTPRKETTKLKIYRNQVGNEKESTFRWKSESLKNYIYLTISFIIFELDDSRLPLQKTNNFRKILNLVTEGIWHDQFFFVWNINRLIEKIGDIDPLVWRR